MSSMIVRDSQTLYIKPDPLKRQNDRIRNRMNTQRFIFFTVSTCRFRSREAVEKNIAENLAVSIIILNTHTPASRVRARNITKNQHINSIPLSFFSWKKGSFFYSPSPSLSPSVASAFVAIAFLPPTGEQRASAMQQHIVVQQSPLAACNSTLLYNNRPSQPCDSTLLYNIRPSQLRSAYIVIARLSEYKSNRTT